MYFVPKCLSEKELIDKLFENDHIYVKFTTICYTLTNTMGYTQQIK